MFPFVLLAMLLGSPDQHPYSKAGYQINGSGRGISGKMTYEPAPCPKVVPASWRWSPYTFSDYYRGGAAHAFSTMGGHGSSGGHASVSH